MGARMPPQGQPQQGGGAAELAKNLSEGLGAMAQIVGNQFGPEAGQAIATIQQQFQQIMMEIGKQGQQQPQAAVSTPEQGAAQTQPLEPGM